MTVPPPPPPPGSGRPSSGDGWPPPSGRPLPPDQRFADAPSQATPVPQSTGVAGMHRLTDQPSPYSVLLAAVVLAIMAAPNAVFFVLDRVVAGQVGTQPAPSEGSLIFGLVVALVLQVIIFLVAMLPLLIRRRLDRRLFGPTQPTGTWLALGFGVIAGVIALFAAYGVNIALALVAGTDEAVEQQLLQDALGGGWSLLLAAVIAVIAAPIVEEIVFRGVLFRALGDAVGLWGGAILASAIFAVIHIEVLTSQPIAMGGLFAVGMALSLAYHYTGNLLVPIVGHAVFNGSSLALALVVDRLGLDDLVALIALTF